MNDEQAKRKAAGEKLFADGYVTVVVGGSVYLVGSESQSGFQYSVNWDKVKKKWSCTCPDYTYHDNINACKHIIAVNMSIDANREFGDTVSIAKSIKRKLTAPSFPDVFQKDSNGHNHIHSRNPELSLTDLDWKNIQDSVAKVSSDYFNAIRRPGMEDYKRHLLQIEYESSIDLLEKIARIRQHRWSNIQP